MKKQELTNKTEKELWDLVVETKRRLRSLLFDLKLAKLQDTSALRKAKKEIARALTVLKIKHGTKS